MKKKIKLFDYMLQNRRYFNLYYFNKKLLKRSLEVSHKIKEAKLSKPSLVFLLLKIQKNL